MKIRTAVSMVVAILSGLVVLASYFVPLEILVAGRGTLIQWAILLSAFAVLVGIINLLIVHYNKLARKQKGAFYSLLLILGMGITFVLGVLSPYYSKLSSAFNFTFQAIQFPVEASLMSVLVVTMTYGSIRLLRHRLSAFSIILIVTALLVLLGMAPLPFIGTLPLVSDTLRPFLAQVLAGSGARGILIGVALGALTTGLRVLLGVDRPYEGK